MPNDSAPLTGSTGLVFYVDLPSANSFCISPNINNATDMTVKVGASYQVLAADGSQWETRTAGTGISGNSLWGSMDFNAAFTGWVYLPWESVGTDTDFVLECRQRHLGPHYALPSEGGRECWLPDLWPAVYGHE